VTITFNGTLVNTYILKIMWDSVMKKGPG